jgi:hypothetical protein
MVRGTGLGSKLLRLMSGALARTARGIHLMMAGYRRLAGAGL